MGERIMTDDEFEQQAIELQERIALMDDRQLLAAYQATDGDPNDPYADALAMALKDRDIDF